MGKIFLLVFFISAPIIKSQNLYITNYQSRDSCVTSCLDWWKYNRSKFYKNSLPAVATYHNPFYLIPSSNNIKQEVIPELESVLEKTEIPEIRSACLIALAKLAPKGYFQSLIIKTNKLLMATIPCSAIFSAGVAGIDEAVPDLINLLNNKITKRFFKNCPLNRPDIYPIAILSLGLITVQTKEVNVYKSISDYCISCLGKESNLKTYQLFDLVGLILCMKAKANPELEFRYFLQKKNDYNFCSLCEQNPIKRFKPYAISSLGLAINSFYKLYKKPKSPKKINISRLNSLAASNSNSFYHFIGKSANEYMKQSYLLAFGRINKNLDSGHLKKLIGLFEKYRKSNPALIGPILYSIADLNNKKSKNYLIGLFKEQENEIILQWSGMCLGIIARSQLSKNKCLFDNEYIGKVLLAKYPHVESNITKSCIALALGLAKYSPAGVALLERLNKTSQSFESKYIIEGLGLMEFKEAIKPIREILNKAPMPSEQFSMASQSVGIIYKQTQPSLLSTFNRGLLGIKLYNELKSLRGPESAAKFAFHFNSNIGDHRFLKIFFEALKNKDLKMPTRARAACAIGEFCHFTSLAHINPSVKRIFAFDPLHSVGFGFLFSYSERIVLVRKFLEDTAFCLLPY